MIKSLFFKEWTKSRWVLLIILLVLAAVTAYAFIGIARDIRLNGYGEVWEMILQKGVTHFNYLKFLPLLAGIVLALSQYVPEMTNKRLKLTLHLPLPEFRMLLTMLLFGIVSLSILFLLTYLTINFGVKNYFSHEIAAWNLASVHPWLWSGLAGYLLTAWVCIEPVWRQRIFNAVMAVVILSLYYFRATPGSYAGFLPFLILLAVLCGLFSYYSLIRFKDGEQ